MSKLKQYLVFKHTIFSLSKHKEQFNRNNCLLDSSDEEDEYKINQNIDETKNRNVPNNQVCKIENDRLKQNFKKEPFKRRTRTNNRSFDNLLDRINFVKLNYFTEERKNLQKNEFCFEFKSEDDFLHRIPPAPKEVNEKINFKTKINKFNRKYSARSSQDLACLTDNPAYVKNNEVSNENSNQKFGYMSNDHPYIIRSNKPVSEKQFLYTNLEFKVNCLEDECLNTKLSKSKSNNSNLHKSNLAKKSIIYENILSQSNISLNTINKYEFKTSCLKRSTSQEVLISNTQYARIDFLAMSSLHKLKQTRDQIRNF